MDKFRKKPVAIEAIQYTGYNQLEIESWAIGHEALRKLGVSSAPNTDIHIHTLEGTMKAVPGDWIIMGIKEEFYPCKPDIFASTYEPVPPPKESQNIPALDKPAEGLAYLEEMSGGSGHRLELFVAGQWMRTFTLEKREFANELTEKINRAHASIVKPLREKVESLEKELARVEAHARHQAECLRYYRDNLCVFPSKLWALEGGGATEVIDPERVTKLLEDRDAWKEKAEDMGKAFLSEQKAAYAAIADADRLASLLKEYRSAQQDMLDDWAEGDRKVKDSLWCKLHDQQRSLAAIEALAAHEALKGKT